MNRLGFFTLFFAWLASAFAQAQKVYEVGKCPVCNTPAPKKPFASLPSVQGACTTASLTRRRATAPVAGVTETLETACHWQMAACPKCLTVYLNKL